MLNSLNETVTGRGKIIIGFSNLKFWKQTKGTQKKKWIGGLNILLLLKKKILVKLTIIFGKKSRDR